MKPNFWPFPVPDISFSSLPATYIDPIHVEMQDKEIPWNTKIFQSASSFRFLKAVKEQLEYIWIVQSYCILLFCVKGKLTGKSQEYRNSCALSNQLCIHRVVEVLSFLPSASQEI